MISIMQLVENQAVVYITGDGLNPDSAQFANARTIVDNGYTPDSENVHNQSGDIHIYVSEDGSTYRVYFRGE